MYLTSASAPRVVFYPGVATWHECDGWLVHDIMRTSTCYNHAGLGSSQLQTILKIDPVPYKCVEGNQQTTLDSFGAVFLDVEDTKISIRNATVNVPIDPLHHNTM